MFLQQINEILIIYLRVLPRYSNFYRYQRGGEDRWGLGKGSVGGAGDDSGEGRQTLDPGVSPIPHAQETLRGEGFP